MDVTTVPEVLDDDSVVTLEDHLAFAGILREHAGIKLGLNKRQLLSSRLKRRLRVLRLDSYRDYRHYLTENMDRELGEFINALTTNLTSFFRENHHFEYLKEYFDQARPAAPIKIWSAGCSTGEEPYSIAMVYQESAAAARRVPLNLSATDIDTVCLARAESGIYDLAGVKGLDRERLARHFLRGRGGNDGKVRVRPYIRDLVSFRQLNLLASWELEGPMDIIFCRNVVIYFDDDVQRVLFHRFADFLKPDGLIVIGHSENLQRVSDRFRNVGRTIYRKVK